MYRPLLSILKEEFKINMSEEKKPLATSSILQARASADLQESVEADLSIEDPEEAKEAFAKIIEPPE